MRRAADEVERLITIPDLPTHKEKPVLFAKLPFPENRRVHTVDAIDEAARMQENKVQ